MRLPYDEITKSIGEYTCAKAVVYQKHNLLFAGLPVKIPPNEPKKPPVEEPGDPYKIPPVEEPWDVPREPPVKEPPPEDPDQIPPQPHRLRRMHNRWAANTACTL